MSENRAVVLLDQLLCLRQRELISVVCNSTHITSRLEPEPLGWRFCIFWHAERHRLG